MPDDDKKRLCCLVVVLTALAVARCVSESDQALLEQKVKKLDDLSYKNGIIRLNGDKFRKYVKNAPRNYSTIVMMTALKAQRQCSVCVLANEEYKALVYSWRSSAHFSTDLFFAMIDFDDAPDIFEEMKMRSAPHFLHFPAKGKKKKEDTMENTNNEFRAEQMANWVERRTQIQIKVYRPFNYVYWGAVLAVVAVVASLLFYLRDKLNLIISPTSCAIAILAVIFTMISGHMWNRIRKASYSYKNPQTGETSYIHPNRQSQFITETYIIMVQYSLICTGFIMLNEIQSLRKRWSKAILALAGLACFLTFFFTLLNTFKFKSPYYPYGFFDLVNDYVWKI